MLTVVVRVFVVDYPFDWLLMWGSRRCDNGGVIVVDLPMMAIKSIENVKAVVCE